MCNADLKEKMRNRGVRQWQIAEYIGISESVLSRHMRHELSSDLRDQVLNAIEILGSTPGAAKVQSVGRGVIVNK